MSEFNKPGHFKHSEGIVNDFELASEQKEAFAQQGILLLKSFVSHKQTSLAKKEILEELNRLKLRVNGRLQTKAFDKIPTFQAIGQLSQRLKMGDRLDHLISDDLVKIMSELSGVPLKPSQPHLQLLLTLPRKEAWEIPSMGWHLDIKASAKAEIPGVQAFVLIDNVEPKGGGTLALSGTHRLQDQKHDRQHIIQNLTKTNLVEMSGKAGDVYLMDMRILHSPSINSSKRLRMMATSRYVR